MQTSTTGLRLTWLAVVTPSIEVSTSGTPQTGNHHDRFQLAALFEELCVLLETTGIVVAGLSLYADSDFDTNELR